MAGLRRSVQVKFSLGCPVGGGPNHPLQMTRRSMSLSGRSSPTEVGWAAEPERSAKTQFPFTCKSVVLIKHDKGKTLSSMSKFMQTEGNVSSKENIQ